MSWLVWLSFGFVAIMALEWAIGKRLGLSIHGYRQTLNNLAHGVGRQVVHGALSLAPFAGYAWLVERVGWLTWSVADPLHWVLGLLVVDLSMYLRHRAAHRVGLLWAIHAVHHQSREYNLTVGLRASLLQDTTLVLVLPAMLGMPVAIALPLWVGLSVWTWWVHTSLIGRLGWLDRWLATPSNHRVHHARNPRYLDRNYGAFLLVWDRLFDTWTAETERPRYGTLAGLPSYDPLVNNLTPWVALWDKLRRAPSGWARLACLWMPPEWDPVQGRMRVPIEVEDPTPQRRLWPTRGRRLASATLLLGGLIAMVAIAVGPPEELRWVMGLGGLACLGLAGALQDGRYRFLGGVRSLRPSLPSRPGARGADGPTATR